MERFRNRIKYYLVGFTIGLILMYMMFGNRGCSWLPENRVKNMLAEKEVLIGDSLLEIMNCAGVTNNDIYALLDDDGEVDFSKSLTHEYPKKYWLTGTKNEKDLSIVYSLFDTLVEVFDFNFETKTNCVSSLSNLHKSTIPLPDADVRAIIESHEIRILEKAECQMACLKLTEAEVKSFHTEASIEIGLSKPRLHPNAVYVLKGKIRNQEMTVTYAIGENRTRIENIAMTGFDCVCPE
jgi:hypothetical protein